MRVKFKFGDTARVAAVGSNSHLPPGTPPVLALRGAEASTSSYLLALLQKALAEDFDVYFLDWLGCGGAPHGAASRPRLR